MKQTGKLKLLVPSKPKSWRRAVLQSLREAVRGKKAKKNKEKEVYDYKPNSQTKRTAGYKYKAPSLKGLVENGRDYSRPTLESQINETRCNNKKKSQWVSIVSIPMGGQNKRR